MSTGENIKKIRKQKGMTQLELAEKCGFLYQTIGKYERDLINPKLGTLRIISQALGVSIGDLVDDWKIFTQEEISEDWKAPIKDVYKEKMSDLLDQLNTDGKDKAIEQVELLTMIDKYKK